MFGLLAAAAFVPGACGPTTTTGSGRSGSSAVVDGLLTEVEGTSPTDVASFTLRTPEGRVLQFAIGRLDLSGDASPAGHLREHLATVEPVRVTYVTESDGSLVAIRLEDAPR